MFPVSRITQASGENRCTKSTERILSSRKSAQAGQALILIAIAIVGLLALVALAIDAGNGFSDRSKAQNAADSAVLAGATAKTQNQSVTSAATARATSNGYTDGINGATVTVSNPPGPGCNGTNGPFAGNSQYIQVIIHSTVSTFFGPIVNINELHNCVEAIARTQLMAGSSQLAMGNTIAAVGCTGLNITASGSADVTLMNGGIYSNSSSNPALYIHKNDNLTAPSVGSVGSAHVPYGYSPAPETGITQLPCPLPDYMIPKYTCSYNYVNFPPASSDANVTKVGSVYELNAGVYCISGSWSKANMTGSDVTFVMLNQGFTWNGNVDIHLRAPTSGATKGLLIFLPYSNTNSITLNGNAGLDITGSVFAPNATIKLSGSFGSTAVQSQWVGKVVDMTGNLQATFEYIPSNSYAFNAPPILEISK
jgi:Flp pilus assembly protein TadG